MTYALTDFLQHSPAPAFTGDRLVLRSELVDHVRAVSVGLGLAHAPSPQRTRVVIACEERAAFTAALFGTWQAGLVAELPPDGKPETMDRLQAEPEVLLVLRDEHVAAYLQTTHDSTEPLRRLAPDTVLVVLHTSGTTATPRRFEKTAQTLLGETCALHSTFGETPATFLATVPPQHLYGLLFGILLPLRRGATIVDRPALFPEDVRAVLEAHAVTTLVSTPTHLRALAALPRAWPRELTVLTSSAPLPAELHGKLVREIGWTVHDVFGSTETGGIATRSTPEARWRPLAGVTVRAAEPDQHLELQSAWSSVDSCEDRIAVAVDGTFEHLGRADDVVKVGGKRVSLSAVEAALRRIPGVTDAAALAVDDSHRGRRLVAFVSGLSSVTGAEQVRAELARELDAVLVPRRVVIVGALPREPNGKLRRERLEALLIPPVEQRRELELVAGSPFFEGHFDGSPVYPGAALLADFASAARAAWPDLGRVLQLRRIRFQRPLGPGSRLHLHLRRSDHGVHFEALAEGEDVASVTGRLEFADAPGEP